MTGEIVSSEVFRVVETAPSRVVVELGGYLSYNCRERLADFLHDVDEQKPATLVLNCSRLLHLDSSILGFLVGLQKQFHLEGRRLVLRWVPETIVRVLELSRLDTFFEVEPERRKRSEFEVPILSERPMLGELKRCWDLFHCEEESCVHFGSETYVCWLTPHVPCKSVISADLTKEIASCAACEVFKNNINQYGTIQEDYSTYIREAESTYLRLAEEKARLRNDIRSIEDFAESLFNRATDAVIIFSSETGEIHSANPQARKILSLPDPSSSSRSIFDICQELRVEPRPWETTVLGEDSHHRRWDHIWKTGTGEHLVMEVTYSPVQTPKERCILAIARDITYGGAES